MGINAGKLTKYFFAVGYGSFFPKILRQSIGKGNLCPIVVVCMAKTNNKQGYKTSTAISIMVVHEQSGKVEYERERLLGIANKLMNFQSDSH
jgi:hypothetical protein